MSIPPPVFESNYPRPRRIQAGGIRPAGVYWDSIAIAYNMLKSNWGVYASSALIVFAVAIATTFGLMASLVGLGSGAPDRYSAGYVASECVAMLVTAVFQLGVVSVGVRHAAGGVPKVADVFRPMSRPGRLAAVVGIWCVAYGSFLLFAGVIGMLAGMMGGDNAGMGIVTAVGIMVLFPLVYLVVMGPMMLGSLAAVWTDHSVIEGFVLAFQRVGRSTVSLGALFMAAGIVSALGAIACYVGVIFTLAIATNVIALHFVYYFPEVTNTFTPATQPAQA